MCAGDIDLKDFLITMLAFRSVEDEDLAPSHSKSADSDKDDCAPRTPESVRLYFDIFVSGE